MRRIINMFKEKYKKIAEQIVPDEKIINEVLNSDLNKEKKKNNIKFKYVHIFVIITVIVAALPVMGSMGYLDKIKSFLGNKERTAILKYTDSFSEKNGIKVTIAGGIMSETAASFFIAAEDTTEKRITKDTSIIGKVYYNNGKNQNIHSWENEGYMNNSVSISKIEFSADESIDKNCDIIIEINKILSDLKKYNNVKLPITIDNSIEVIKNDNTNEFYNRGIHLYSNDEYSKENWNKEEHKILIKPKEDKTTVRKDIDCIYINGARFVNGKLYINIAFKDRFMYRTNVELYILDEKGNKIEPLWANSMAIPENNKENNIDNRDYMQYVFDINESEFKNCKVYSNIEYYATEIDDIFTLNIDSNTISENNIVKENVAVGDKVIKRLEISPVCIVGIIENYKGEGYWGELIYNDGKVEEFSSCIEGDSVYNGYGGFIGYTEKYIDLEHLAEVKINDTTVYKK